MDKRCAFILLFLIGATNLRGALLDDFSHPESWAISVPAKAPIKNTGRLAAGPDGMTVFTYEFPQVPYGYGYRDTTITLSRPVSVSGAFPVWTVDVFSREKTGHMLYLRIADVDGTVRESRPFILNTAGEWKTVSVPLAEMQKTAAGANDIFDPPATTFSIVVQQAMTSRWGAPGFYRRGEIGLRNLRVEDSEKVNREAEALNAIDFDGKIFPPPAGRAASATVVPLDLPVSGESVRYPLRTGIPFPQGSLPDPGHLGLFADGAPAAFQPRVLSRWPDGSVKVVLAQFAADLTGKTRYELRTGAAGRRITPGRNLCSESESGITVDTGALNAVIARRGTALLDRLALKRGRRTIPVLADPGLSARLARPGKMLAAVKETVAVEENGPLFSVVRVEGKFRDDATAPYRYLARLYFMKESAAVRCAFTFISDAGRTETDLPDIRLEARRPDIQKSYSFGRENAFSGTFDGRTVALFQDGPVYNGGKVKYGYAVTADGRKIAEGEKFDGYASSTGKAGPSAVGIFECWENHPKRIVLAPDRWMVDLSCGGGVRAGTGRGKFYHGMAKTTDLMFDFSGGAAARDFLRDPVALASPAWYCASGAFGNMPVADDQGFPVLEECTRSWIRNYVTARDFGDMYGLRDFGDYYSDNQDAWMDQETAVGLAMTRQGLRTGNREYFALARQASRHFADIDTCHVPIPKELEMDKSIAPERTLGAAYCHSYEHVGRADRPEHYQPGVGGHNWYMMVVYTYLLTGDEWLRDNCLLNSDCTVREINDYFKGNTVLAREYAWPIKNLAAVYEISGNAGYLQAAAKLVNFWYYWRDSFGTNKFSNDFYNQGIVLSGIRDYYETTRDVRARDFFVAATRRMLENVEYHPGEALPQECLYNADNRLLLFDVLPDLYAFTGEKRYIADYVDCLYFFVKNSLLDSTMFWCGPGFQGAMKKLSIPEPVTRRYTPVITNFDQPKGGPVEVEAILFDGEDKPFTVTVSRVAAFRMGRIGRGLIEGNWEGYVNPDGKRRTENISQTFPHFGLIRILDPGGREVSRGSIPHMYSKTYTFSVPKDGQTGVYRVKISLADTLFHSILVDSSLTGLMVPGGKYLLNINPVYFYVPPDREISVRVTPRKGGRYVGAALYAPDGKKAGEFYCDDKASVYPALPAKGEGVWMLERCMLAWTSRLAFDNFPAYIAISREAVFKGTPDAQ